MIPKIDFALDQQPREPLPAPVFTALCPGSPCAVCGAIEDAGGITATPRTRGLCAAHFKAETQITLKAETGANAHLCAAYVATLPTGERVELPAGTVLREGTGGRAYEPAIIAMREPRPVCCKAAIECSALNWQPLVPSWQMTWGCVQHCPFCGDRLTPPPIKLASAEEERAILPRVVGYTIRERRGERTQIIVGDADGRTIELMHVTPAMLMRAADRRVHGEETSR